jgi:hypothetical protein
VAKPILRVRIITTMSHAQTLTAKVVDEARALLGPGVVYRTQTRTADRTGNVTAYVTATSEGGPS